MTARPSLIVRVFSILAEARCRQANAYGRPYLEALDRKAAR